jgi:hypothetical protein
MKNPISLLSLFTVAGFILTSCEGPMGKDANETCKLCHNNDVVDAKAVQFEFSKHSYGEAAFEEAGSTGCGPCHLSEAFKYVCKNNVPVTFTLDATSGKYVNDYASSSATAYGELGCFTCHSSLHTTYDDTDFYPLTTTAAVPMTMWKGAKTINLTKTDGNLCVKCHQPRPFTASNTNGDVIDYASTIQLPVHLQLTRLRLLIEHIHIMALLVQFLQVRAELNSQVPHLMPIRHIQQQLHARIVIWQR